MNETEMIQLVTKAQAGDRDAFGKLAQQFEQTVFATVLRRLRNHAEAVEVTQDVFIQAMRKLPQLREPALMQGDVTVLGSGDFLEVWDRERLREQEKLTAEDHQRLSEFGI